MEAIPSLPFTISRREFASKQVANGVCVWRGSFFSFSLFPLDRGRSGAGRAGSSFHRSLFKVSWLCMVTRSKSYVHSWHFVIIVRPVRQEIVHHARTYGGRVKGNESPSSLRAFGSLAFRAILSVYTPSVFSLFPPSLQHFSPLLSLSLFAKNDYATRYQSIKEEKQVGERRDSWRKRIFEEEIRSEFFKF